MEIPLEEPIPVPLGLRKISRSFAWVRNWTSRWERNN